MSRFKGMLGEQMTQWASYWRELDRPDLAQLCAEIGELWTPTWKQFLPWNSWRAMRRRQQLDKLLRNFDTQAAVKEQP